MKKQGKSSALRRAVPILAAATVAAVFAGPIAGSAANLSSSSFSVKAQSASEGNHFAIKPFFSGKAAPIPEPTAPVTTPPTTPAPSPTPTGPTLDPNYPSPTSEAQFTWAQNADGTAKLMTFKGTVTDVVIPQTAVISGTPRAVTAIERKSFEAKGLTSVVIPDTVKAIGDYTFYNNKLTSVKLPSALITLEAYAFGSNLLSSVTIPDRLTVIGNYAFNNNRLTSLSLGSSVSTIESMAFSSNYLSSVKLPASLTSMRYQAFATNNITSIAIPEGVTALEEGVFRYNRLTSVSLPSTLRSIGPRVFLSNMALKELRIPASVTYIGDEIVETDIIARIYMEGNAPLTVSAAGRYGSFGTSSSSKVVYYKAGATGYSNPWKGYATATY